MEMEIVFVFNAYDDANLAIVHMMFTGFMAFSEGIVGALLLDCYCIPRVLGPCV